MKEIIITEKNAGGRLNKLLFSVLDKANSGFVYKMLRKKNITLNDSKASGNEILKPGDSIKIFFSDNTFAKFNSRASETLKNEAGNVSPGKTDDAPEEIKNQKLKKTHLNLSKALIVYEDENIIAINKPIGLLSQKAAPSDVSADDFIKEYIPSDDTFTPGIANRLDRNTGGIILAGKNLAASRELNRSIKERSLGKYYICAVKGLIEAPGKASGRVIKDERTNQVKILDSDAEEGQIIVTAWKPLLNNGSDTLTEVDLITGKSHQIRAHMAHMGHPLFGDSKYGDDEINNTLIQKYGLKSQLLFAYKVVFREMTGILSYLNGTEITAPLPAAFMKVLEGENLWPHGAQED